MVIRFKHQIRMLLLVMAFLPFGTPVIANDAAICTSFAELKRQQQGAATAWNSADSVTTINQLSKLSRLLKRVKLRYYSSADSRSLSDMSFAISALDRILLNPNSVGADVSQKLPDLMRVLQKIELIFGCSDLHQITKRNQSKPLELVDRSNDGTSSMIAGGKAITLGVSVLALIALIIVSVVVFRRGFTDRAVRLVCRTPLLLVHGDNCSVTNILDINRSGMKVEVAPEHAEKIWVDLFFCGHKARGQIVWKNSYFAGIQFKPKISPQMLKDVIEKSRISLADSGIQSNAAPCFSLGCHATCSRHQSTAISRSKEDN